MQLTYSKIESDPTVFNGSGEILAYEGIARSLEYGGKYGQAMARGPRRPLGAYHQSDLECAAFLFWLGDDCRRRGRGGVSARALHDRPITIERNYTHILPRYADAGRFEFYSASTQLLKGVASRSRVIIASP